MDNDQRQQIIYAGRKRVLLRIVLPVLAVLLAIILFGAWRLAVSNSQGASNETKDTLTRVQPVTIITLEELLSLPSPDIRISESNQVIVNGSLRANKAIIISPSQAPDNPETGELYYDSTTNNFRYYDGASFITVASQDPSRVICYIGDDCGFLRVEDLPAGLTLPQPLGTTDSPTFANLTITNDLAVSQGGTGRGSFATNSLLLGNGTGDLLTTNTPVAGQVLVTNALGVPAFVSLSGDVAITTTGASSLNPNTVDASELVSSGVTAGSYGDAANYPTFTVDADGRITAVSTEASGGAGAVTALNTLTGGLTLQGTVNQVVVSDNGSNTITLTLPQDIATTSAPTFATINTGNGNLEVNTIAGYLGNQNLRTSDSPTFASLTIGTTNFTEADLDALDDGLITLGTETSGAYDSTPDTIADDGTIDTTEITDDTIAEVDLDVSNGPIGGYILSSDGVGGFTWIVDDTGTPHLTEAQVEDYIFDGDNGVKVLSSGTLALGSLSFTGALSDVNVADALTIVGGSIDSTTSIDKDPIITLGTDLVGNITLNNLGGGTLNASLAANTVDSSELVDGSVDESHLNVTNGGAGVDGYLLSYNDATGDFTWVADGTGTDNQNLFETISTPNGTSPVADSPTDTLTFLDGTGITVTGSAASDQITFALANTAVGAGAYGAANTVGTFTVDAQGRLTAAGDVAIAIAGEAITSGTVADGRLSANVTLLGATLTKDEITNSGVLAFDWANSEVADDLTISSSGTVDWTALSSYPSACGAGEAVTTIGDTLTCTAFSTTDNNTFALIQIDGGATQNVGAPTLDFDGTDFSVTESPADDFDISLANNSLTVTAGTGLTGGGAVALGGSTTINLGNTAVSSGSYGGAGTVGTFTVDGQGRLTAATDVAIAINASQVTAGTLAIARGGTNAATAQAAIDNLSGLTTNGDLLFHNGSNSTRLARGTTNQCLLATAASIQWGACTAGGGGFTNLSLAADSGTPETLNDTDTITITGGSNITTSVGATDTVTVDLDSAPTLSGLLTLNGGLTMQLGDTFTFNGDAFTSLTGTGLEISSGSLQLVNDFGSSIDTSEITDGTILEADLNITNAPAGLDNYILSFNEGSGNFTWVADGTGTDNQNLFETISTPNGTSPVADSPTDTLTFLDGTGITVTGSAASDQITFALANTAVGAGAYGAANTVGTFTVDAQGRLTAAGDVAIAIAGEAITSGTVADGRLSANVTLLGATLTKDEITNSGVLAFDWANSEVADDLTISSSGTVDWTALTGYPGACGAGTAVTTIGDTLTCTAFDTTVDNVTGDVDTGEITNDTILAVDLDNTTAPGAGEDNYILSYDNATGGFTWVVDGTGTDNQNLFETISTPNGTSPVADSATDTLTFADGAGITITGTSGTDTITIAATLGATVDLTSEVGATILPIANGGTGASSLNNLITLGTHTTGNYVANVTGNSQIAVGGSAGEGWTPTLSIQADSIGDTQLAFNTGQHLTTTSAPQFATIDTGNGAMEVNTIAAYLGNQDLETTDSVTFNALTLTTDLTVANGGTGVSSLTDHGVLLGSGTGAVTVTAVGTNGQCLLGNTGADPTWGTCTGDGVGISDLNGETGTTQSFANDTNVTISSGSNTHTLGWTGTLAVARGGTGASSLNNLITLGTHTTGNYVSNISSGTGVAVTGSPGEGWTPTVAFDYTATLASNPGLAAGETIFGTTGLLFEGSGVNDSETLLTVANPTTDRTITLPDASGTVVTTGNLTAITATGTITSGIWNGTAITDTYVADTLTVDASSTVNSLALTDGGTISFDWTNAEVADDLTINGSGSVTWTALTSYPGACGAGTAVTTIGDTLTCTAFATSDTTYSAGNDLDLSATTFNIEPTLNFVTTITRASSDLTLQTTTSGDIVLDTVGTISAGGDIIPDADDTHDLGSSGARWQDLYLGPQTLYIGTGTADQFTLGYNTTLNEAVINEAGDDIDLRVESDTHTDAFVVQGSDGQITLGALDCSAGDQYITANASGVLSCGTDNGAGAGNDLQGAYSAGTDGIIQLDGTRNGIFIQDAGSTVGDIFVVEDAAGTTDYLTVTTSSTTINGDLAVTAGNYISLAGGNTASRPGSPTEGMLYFDTQTDTLLVYSNGKWKADSGEYIIVAANDSTQAEKDSAHYVADGTSDQTEINNALTAASGGKVLLLAGTYVADGTILIPNNTTLAGVGPGTVVQLDVGTGTDNLVEATGTSRTGQTIRDLKLDGSLGTSGTQRGIYLSSVGNEATYRAGAVIENVTVESFVDAGIYIDASSYNVLNGNITHSNATGVLFASSSNSNTMTNSNSSNNSPNQGVRLISSSNNTFTGNTLGDNGAYGIELYSSSNNNTITGNTFYSDGAGSTGGIYLNSSSFNTVSANTVVGTGTAIYLHTSANNNTVSDNTIHDSGGAGNNAVRLSGADKNIISSNVITDSSCSSGCNAIIIASSTSDDNYLSDNIFEGDGVNEATISDSGTGTVYANQLNEGLDSATADLVLQAPDDIIINEAGQDSDLRVESDTHTDAFVVQGSDGQITLGALDCSGNANGGAITASAGGVLSCTDDNVGSTPDLQAAYDSGNTITTTDARDVSVVLANTATDSDFTVNIVGTGNTFEIQDAGVATFQVADGGSAYFQTEVDSTTGFQVLDTDGGTSILNVDTTNERIGIGYDAPGRKLHIVDNNTPLRVDQQFSGDNNSIRAGIEVFRGYSGGTGADGIGSAVDFLAETESEGTYEYVGKLQFSAVDATATTVDSQFKLQLFTNSSETTEVTVTGTQTILAGELVVGDGSIKISDGSSNYATIGVNSLASDYTVDIPTITANDTFCLVVEANCGGSYVAGNDLDLSGSTFNIESQLDFVTTISRASSNLTLQTTTSGDIILNSASGDIDFSGDDLVEVGNNIAAAGQGLDIYVDNGLSVSTKRIDINGTSGFTFYKPDNTVLFTLRDGPSVGDHAFYKDDGSTISLQWDESDDQWEFNTDVVPQADDTYDLGSSSLRWQDLYLGPQTLHIGTTTGDEGTIGYNTTLNQLVFNDAGDSIDLRIEGDTDTDLLFVDASAEFVGIGTSTPGNKLHVYSAGTSARVSIEAAGANSAAQFVLINDVRTWNVGVNGLDDYRVRDNTGGNDIFTIQDGASANSLFIESTGNIGVNDSSPSYKLDVDGTGRFTGILRAADAYLTPQDGTNEGGELKLEGAASYGDVQLDNYQGNVRIHTLASGKTFQILGGNGLSSTSGVFSGTVDANEYYGDTSSETDPSFTFQADQDTGIYQDAANRLQITTGGNRKLECTSARCYFVNELTVANGSATTPGLHFIGSTNSGVWWNSTGGFIILTEGGSTVLSGNGSNQLYFGGMATGTYQNVSANGTQIYKASSSQRYKHNIHSPAVDPDTLLDLTPQIFKYKPQYNSDQRDWLWFIAEEVYAAAGENFIFRDADESDPSAVSDVDQKAVLALAVLKIQDQEVHINNLENGNLSQINVSGQSTLNNLTVTGTATLAKLSVTGTATIKTLVVSGNATIAGDLAVSGDTTVADIYVNGHIVSAGDDVAAVLGTSVELLPDVAVVVEGNDTAGTITFTTGTDVITPTKLAQVKYVDEYSSAPRVVLSATNEAAILSSIYLDSSASNKLQFTLTTATDLLPNTVYTFNYIIIQ